MNRIAFSCIFNTFQNLRFFVLDFQTIDNQQQLKIRNWGYGVYYRVSGKRRKPTLTRDNKIKFDNNEEPNFNNFDTCDNLFTWFRF